jgi:excisionase family DNA binding protein
MTPTICRLQINDSRLIAVNLTVPDEDDSMLQNIRETGRRAHTIAETCALTGLGRDSIYSAIRSGRLLARKFGRRTVITDDDLRQFLAGLPRAGLATNCQERG